VSLGLRKTAELHGVDVASLRKWVAACKALGVAGIQRKRSSLDELEEEVPKPEFMQWHQREVFKERALP
jgi:hypothetical protein